MFQNVPAVVQGDPGRFRQILMNLVGNAIKFTEVGEVSVQMALEHETEEDVVLQVQVIDSGIGLSPQQQYKLFQPFTQADSSTTRKYGGTGLGLAISKQLVEAMNGTISVISELGQGSCFTVQLRFQREKCLEEVPKISNLLQGLRVCCVDDNQTNRMVLYHYTHAWGMEPLLAESAQQALDLLREESHKGRPCDLAILDMNMPQMDGIELAQTIKADPALKNVRLVLLSSGSFRGDSAKFLEVDFEAFLSKPVRKNDLLASLESLMSRTKAETALISYPVEKSRELRNVSFPRVVGNLLVVDDHGVNQQLAQMMLERLGHRVDVVSNGLEAIEAIKMIPYDLVFMDCQMPEMDGYEATKIIREMEDRNWDTLNREKAILERTPDVACLLFNRISRVPIVAMTANAMKGDREKCLAAGMDDYISKPIKPEELALIISKWLSVKEKVGVLIHDSAVGSSPQEKDGLGREPRLRHGSSFKGQGDIPEPILSSDLLADWRAAGGSEFVVKVLTQFIHDAIGCIESIQRALDLQSANDLQDAAHGLKGMAANMGLTSLSDLSKQLESLGREKNLPDSVLLVESIRHEFICVQTALEELLAQENRGLG